VTKYHLISCHVLWRELCHFASVSSNVFTMEFLEQGLHNTPDLLRVRLQDAVDRANPEAEAILLGYGLCSNGVMGVVARDKPLVVVRAHDCVTFLLGSKERYREYFDSHPGTYWYSPGWIETSTMPGAERYDAALKQYIEIYGQENAEYLMQMEQGWLHHYSNAAYVDLGFGETEGYKTYTREAAEWLHWQCEFLEGDPRLVRNLLEGHWDSADFLVVQPGYQIVPSHDELVITAVPAA